MANDEKPVFEITYTGKGLSLNSVRGGKWRTTHATVKALKGTFSWLIIEAKIPKLRRYKIHLTYHSAFDCDNAAYMIKVAVDSLRLQGRVVDDTKEYYRGISITVDETLPYNTYKFQIAEV